MSAGGLWQVLRNLLWLLYAIFYLIIAVASVTDNLNNAYPLIYTAPDAVIDTFVLIAILLFAFRVSRPAIRLLAKILLPLSILMLAIGTWMDVAHMAKHNLYQDPVLWLVLIAPPVMCFVPAFFALYGLGYAVAGRPSH